MKSMCHDARRNSPSVADCRPTSSCMRTTSRIASSSIGAQLVGVDPPAGEVVARPQQLGRAQQAADVVGAERRSVAQAHGAPRSGSSASARWATAKAALAAGTPQ